MFKAFPLLLALFLAVSPPVWGKTADLPDAPLSKAEYKFAIKDISVFKNTVTFVIPKNARDHQKKGDAVVMSAIYDQSREPAELCPVVDSHDVRKDLKQYDPFSGKARITATFDDASKAKRASEAGCLLIQDIKG